MASIKLNDFRVEVINGTAWIQHLGRPHGIYYIDELLKYQGKSFKTLSGAVMPSELVDVMLVYLKQMKLYPKNNKQPF